MADFFDPGRQSSTKTRASAEPLGDAALVDAPDKAIPPREKLSFYFEGGFERKKHMLTHRALYLEIFSLSNPSHRSFYIYSTSNNLEKNQESYKQ